MVDLHSDGGLGNGPERNRRIEPSQPSRPLTDREVPLPQPDLGSERVLSATVHAWLDGELPEASVRRGETAKDVEFWNRLGQEADRRREMRMPAQLEAKIMASLPHNVPALITPWYQREFVITPSAAVTVGATLVAVTAAVTALLMRVIG